MGDIGKNKEKMPREKKHIGPELAEIKAFSPAQKAHKREGGIRPP